MVQNTQKANIFNRSLPVQDNGVKVFGPIIKPKVDKREYRGLRLTNGLRVMLISDPETDKSGVALVVNVGSLSDPIHLQGLAHFLEHMLFLGTKKYPVPDNYSEFLSQHAGYNNAYTSSTNTNYYFDIDPKHLVGALDRFAHFFITPLFNSVYTEKELNAVHSEYEQFLDSDKRRNFFVNKETCDPTHDYHKFNIGNKRTLKEIPEANNIDVREELLNFHSKYYSANIMTLCVLGKESLDELYDIVVNRLPFNEIKNKNIKPKFYDKNPFQAQQLQKVIKIVPIKDIKELIITFPTADFYEKYYRAQPNHYVSHLIGHEGKGGIFSELKSKGWVNALIAYGERMAPGIADFNIKIELTSNGMEHIDEIITIMFQYINMLKKEGSQKWIFDECKIMKDIEFDFKEKGKPRDYVSTIASNMQDFSIEEAVKSYYILDEYIPEAIENLLSYLRPDNFRYTIVSKSFEGKTDRKEKYYNIDYSYEDIEEDKLKLWKNAGLHSDLHLPSPNEFIPANLDLVERENERKVPIILRKDNYFRIWYLQDNEFKLPKAFFGIHIKSPVASFDPLTISCLSIYTMLLKDSLNEYSYSASLAGIHYEVFKSYNGLILEFFGYSEKLHVILSKVIDHLVVFDFTKERFEISKELHYRKLKNFKHQSLTKILAYYYTLLSSEKSFSVQEFLDIVDHLTYDKVKEVVNQFFTQIFIEAFVHGNVNEKDADLLINQIKGTLLQKYHSTPAPKSCLLPKRHLKLKENSIYIYDELSEVHKNNAILSYYQFKMQDKYENVKIELLNNIFQEKFYHTLRTEEQLGYLVYMNIKCYLGVQGIYFLIQSSYKPDYLDERIDHFINWAQNYLNLMSEDEFNTYKESLKVLKCEAPKKLINKSQEFWNEILLNGYNFEKREVELEALKNITHKDILDTFDDYFVKNAKKLSIRITGDTKHNISKENEEKKSNVKSVKNTTLITDVTAFQSSLESFSILSPYLNID